MLSSIIIEGVILWFTGTTPGKYLTGLKLVYIQSSKLSLPVALNRSISVWSKGFGFGLPIVSFVTAYLCY
jgi:uncharacterized RDD family membrane protein YckC